MEAKGASENDHHHDEDDRTRPFEWLTSPASLDPFLLMAMGGGTSNIRTNDDVEEDCAGEAGEEGGRGQDSATVSERTKKILHVGSGRSALGEYLALEAKFGAALVVNADSDREALEAMRRRWDKVAANLEQEKRRRATEVDEKQERDQCMERGSAEVLFEVVGVGGQPMQYPDGYFDAVVDKSTLDCAICNHGNSGHSSITIDGGRGRGNNDPDPSVADFLCEVHRLLRPDGGVYLLVSFHSVDFIRPLLLAPGLEWDVEAFAMERQAESLQPGAQPTSSPLVPTANHPPQNPLSDGDVEAQPSRTPWSSNGTFEPDEAYQRTVNVLLCRRRPSDSSAGVTGVADGSEVAAHVDAVMDKWFRQTNPMLTRAREEAIRQQMPACVSLQTGYEILFTDSERAHYTYDLFLEDWDAYCDSQDGKPTPRQEMSRDIAIQFLREMQ
jgi:SAM-dependent methyltransferase